jgi:hypothetical protein
MPAPLTPEADNAVAGIAQRYGLSRESVLLVLSAVNAGGGTMAQFSIPEIGSGQWMQGGMTMAGNMFDHGLQARVDALCNELSQLLATTLVYPAAPTGYHGGFSSASWWPADLGAPSSSGGQNDARYAIFPSTRRLAIQVNGVTTIFDTGEHRIGGVQQQQGGAYGSLSFTSQFGTFDVSSLPEVSNVPGPGAGPLPDTPPPAPAPRHEPDPPPQPVPQAQPPAPASGAPADAAAIIAAIESLAGLHQRGILSDQEFATKKAELLDRL